MPRVSSHFGLRDARLQSVVFEQITIATPSADSNLTLTTDQVLGGWIHRSGLTAGRTDTMPTAAQLVEAIQGCMVGTAFVFRIRNISAGAFTQTLAAGAGGTIPSGNTMTTAQNNDHAYRVLFTNVGIGTEAYTLYSLGAGGGF